MSNNIVGVGKAAQVFFGKSVSELNAAEAATVIAVANAPSRYNPYKNADSCKKKRDVVLSVMYESGIIDKNTYLKSVDSQICVKDIKLSDNSTSWYTETVLSDMIKDLMNKKGYSYEAAKLLVYTKGINTSWYVPGFNYFGNGVYAAYGIYNTRLFKQAEM